MTEFNSSSVSRIFLWVYAAPVLTTWAIVSFLPIAGVLIDGVSLISMLGDALFFLLGFAGLFTVYLFALYLTADRSLRTKILKAPQDRVGFFATYATLWLVGYWLFKFLVV